MKKTVVVTGGAGFIGSRVSYEYARNGHEVLAIDNLNDYYSIDLKNNRIKYFLANQTAHNIPITKIPIRYASRLNLSTTFAPKKPPIAQLIAKSRAKVQSTFPLAI